MAALLFFVRSASLVLPILAGGLMLIWVLKNNFLTRLNVPIDSYKTFGGKRLLGDNKTWRGALIYMVIAVLACYVLGILQTFTPALHPIFSSNPFLLGLIFSISYMIGEFLNSFVKRRFGIAAGEQSGKKTQEIIDNIDGMVALSFVLIVVFSIPFESIIIAVGLGIIIHLLTDRILRQRGLKT